MHSKSMKDAAAPDAFLTLGASPVKALQGAEGSHQERLGAFPDLPTRSPSGPV